MQSGKAVLEARAKNNWKRQKKAYLAPVKDLEKASKKISDLICPDVEVQPNIGQCVEV